MSASHYVKLPHPKRDGITTGTCDCGWVITYSWGSHGNAITTGVDHIEQVAGSQAISIPRADGSHDLIKGASL